jgi:hypothetical protein
MGLASTPYTVTTSLLVAFAVFIIFIRIKGWIDSNIPLIFYVAAITYMRAVEGSVPIWLICSGLGLTLLLRFEFMNQHLTGAVRTLEIGVLSVLIYLSFKMIFY